MIYRYAITAAAALVLTGCGSMSGLDSSSKFSCAAPDGVTCMSVSGIYANAKANNLPGQEGSQRQNITPESTSEKSAGTTRPKSETDYFSPPNNISSGDRIAKTAPSSFATPNFGMPLRTPERILRVWIAPFEDTQGDLHDQKYVYVQVTKGQWTIEANKQQIKNKFRSVRPLSSQNPANKQAESSMNPTEAARSLVTPLAKPQRGQPLGDVEGIESSSFDMQSDYTPQE